MSTSGALSPRSRPAKVSCGEGSPGSAAADRPSTDERPSRSRPSSRPIRAAQARADGPWAKTRSTRRAASRARGVWWPGAGFGLIFVDGDHQAEAVRHDVGWVLRLLAPGAVPACHDYSEDCCCPGVRQALDELFPEGGELTNSLFVVRR